MQVHRAYLAIQQYLQENKISDNVSAVHPADFLRRHAHRLLVVSLCKPAVLLPHAKDASLRADWQLWATDMHSDPCGHAAPS